MTFAFQYELIAIVLGNEIHNGTSVDIWGHLEKYFLRPIQILRLEFSYQDTRTPSWILVNLRLAQKTTVNGVLSWSTTLGEDGHSKLMAQRRHYAAVQNETRH
ncbi:hypothetical protein RRG08_053654 [Elysia crispata]|uniref:Uncharacterized protein n=1 Tax=Elysia crispata TaxID=231223 RepID=A0AAE0ZPR7_9GAST|nr:hypothetical protein RRG08_053654 [Elysia crispata]